MSGAKTPEKEMIDLLVKAYRAGFELARDHAWVSSNTGWAECAPYIEWGEAEVELEKQIREIEGKKKQDLSGK